MICDTQKIGFSVCACVVSHGQTAFFHFLCGGDKSKEKQKKAVRPCKTSTRVHMCAYITSDSCYFKLSFGLSATGAIGSLTPPLSLMICAH